MKDELSQDNTSNEEIKDILKTSKVVAVVGLSTDTSKSSYVVAEYLQNNGYKIIPINPSATEILGEKSYPDLKSIPVKIDIVDIFRKAEAIPQIVNEAIEVGAKVVWMQQGIYNNSAKDKAKAAGLKVVMDKCIKIEHSMI